MKKHRWAVLLVAFVIIAWMLPSDSSDRSHWRRSNLGLRIDAATGCHYLVTGSIFGGGITPRLDADGRQICSGWRGEMDMKASGR